MATKTKTYELTKDKSREDGVIIWRAEVSDNFAVEVDAKTEAEARKKIDEYLNSEEVNV